MNPQLPRCSLDRPHPVCVLPSDLLEQFHLRSPVHRPPCRLRRQSSQLVSEGGPNVTSTSGPNQNSEITSILNCLGSRGSSYGMRCFCAIVFIWRDLCKGASPNETKQKS